MASTPTVLIAAVSGRALAASARRAGYAPLVTDFFGDQDTIAAAHAHVRIKPRNGRDIDPDELIVALQTLAVGREPTGAGGGTRFQGRPRGRAGPAPPLTPDRHRPTTVAQAQTPHPPA